MLQLARNDDTANARFEHPVIEALFGKLKEGRADGRSTAFCRFGVRRGYGAFGLQWIAAPDRSAASATSKCGTGSSRRSWVVMGYA